MNIKKNISILLLFFTISTISAQKFTGRGGTISFKSKAPMETIIAYNIAVSYSLLASTGDINFQLLIKSFMFPKTLMQEQFNESSYMDSYRIPTAKFIGKITNLSKIKFNLNGEYPAIVDGILTIHGISKPIQAQGTITVSSGKISGISTFSITTSDFIKIHNLVRDKISNKIEITVDIPPTKAI